MPEEDFKRGEAKALLDTVTRDVGEIKQTMKDHNSSDEREFGKINDKLDDVAEDARDASEKAAHAEQRVVGQERLSDERHQETQKTLRNIEKTVDKIADNQATTDKRVAKVYTVAGIVGGGAGILMPRLLDVILKNL